MPDDKVYIANGEQAIVKAVFQKYIIAELRDPQRLVRIPIGTGSHSDNGDGEQDDDKGGGSVCDWDLAYAITVHKAQGAQWPVIIYCLDEYPGATGQHGVCDRAHFYTGISRAQKACFLVGMKHVADSMCGRSFIGRRKTAMVELIKEFVAKAEVTLGKPVAVELEEDGIW